MYEFEKKGVICEFVETLFPKLIVGGWENIVVFGHHLDYGIDSNK